MSETEDSTTQPGGNDQATDTTGAAGTDQQGTDSQAAGTGGDDNLAGLSGAEAAMARAKARKTQAAGNNDSTDSDSQQAAGDTGESTGDAAEEGEQASSDDDSTGDQSGDEDTTSGDSIEAPQDWPQAMKEQFSALPTDEAKQLVLDMNKDLQGGFTKGMQQLKEQMESNKTLFETMQTHGVDAKSVESLLDQARLFEENPKQLLQQLAAQKGVEVWFERPIADGEVPQFEDATEMAKWVADEAERRATAKMEAERKAEQARIQSEQVAEQIRQQFSEAASSHPDFTDHQQNVIGYMAEANEQGLSVENAYRLATYDGLKKLAEDGVQAKQEVAALKQELESLKARSTQPAKPASQVDEEDLSDLRPAERAMYRARKRISSQKHF